MSDLSRCKISKVTGKYFTWLVGLSAAKTGENRWKYCKHSDFARDSQTDLWPHFCFERPVSSIRTVIFLTIFFLHSFWKPPQISSNLHTTKTAIVRVRSGEFGHRYTPVQPSPRQRGNVCVTPQIPQPLSSQVPPFLPQPSAALACFVSL